MNCHNQTTRNNSADRRIRPVLVFIYGALRWWTTVLLANTASKGRASRSRMHGGRTHGLQTCFRSCFGSGASSASGWLSKQCREAAPTMSLICKKRTLLFPAWQPITQKQSRQWGRGGHPPLVQTKAPRCSQSVVSAIWMLLSVNAHKYLFSPVLAKSSVSPFSLPICLRLAAHIDGSIAEDADSPAARHDGGRSPFESNDCWRRTIIRYMQFYCRHHHAGRSSHFVRRQHRMFDRSLPPAYNPFIFHGVLLCLTVLPLVPIHSVNDRQDVQMDPCACVDHDWTISLRRRTSVDRRPETQTATSTGG